MIKHISFVSRLDHVSSEEFGEKYRSALAGHTAAPVDARPDRVTAGTVLRGLGATDDRHDGIGILWFRDEHHLVRFEEWMRSPESIAVRDALAKVVDSSRTGVFVADEAIGRGADWLVQRWADGGVKMKHMAGALRAEGLTAQQFSAMWRNRAGTHQLRRGNTTVATELPTAVKGFAYIQNHQRERVDGNWAYDAVNEVYFDDLAGLRARIDWFVKTAAVQDETDFVQENCFFAVAETPVHP